ncbi:MAG: DedA family protein [Acidimicrobiales bacterium]
MDLGSLLGRDLTGLLEAAGTIGLVAIIFAESGILAGFFLPGDSLLFTAGLLASQGKLSLPVILVGCFLAAVAGDQVGYVFGRRVGPALFRRPSSRLFSQRNLTRAQAYFEDHGPKTVVLARFLPVIRTFTPVVAGVAGMEYRQFVIYNVAGGFAWAVGLISLGYILGEVVPEIEKYLIPAVLVIAAVSFVPVIKELASLRREAKAAGGQAAGE